MSSISAIGTAAAPVSPAQNEARLAEEAEAQKRAAEKRQKEEASRAEAKKEERETERTGDDVVARTAFSNSRLSIEARQESDTYIYKSIDKASGEKIDQWPAEALLRVRDAQRELSTSVNAGDAAPASTVDRKV